MAALAERDIEPIDLVCVNLYPFDSVAGRKDTREEEAVEMIDIGGPALLRAAAKNFLHVVPVCSPAQYGPVLAELERRGDLTLQTRRALAAEAFATTAAYEASIATWFAERESFPPRIALSLSRERELAYGENPHQRAAYYSEAGARRHLLSRVSSSPAASSRTTTSTISGPHAPSSRSSPSLRASSSSTRIRAAARSVRRSTRPTSERSRATRSRPTAASSR